MNFLQKNSTFGGRRTEKKKSFVALISVLFLIVIFSLSISRNFLFALVAPLWNGENSVVVFLKNESGLLESKQSLIAENNILQQTVAQNQENVLIDSLLKSENDDLKNILNRKPENQKQILAAILEKPFLSPYDTLIVDAGSADGVVVGDQVLADGNIAIGSVAEVYDHSAKVVLYSSAGEKTNVLIGTSSIAEVAVGEGGGNFSVQLPKGANISVGDAVVVPSIATNLFATVETIDTTDTDSFETVVFRSPVNIDELAWVEIVPAP